MSLFNEANAHRSTWQIVEFDSECD